MRAIKELLWKTDWLGKDVVIPLIRRLQKLKRLPSSEELKIKMNKHLIDRMSPMITTPEMLERVKNISLDEKDSEIFNHYWLSSCCSFTKQQYAQNLKLLFAMIRTKDIEYVMWLYTWKMDTTVGAMIEKLSLKISNPKFCYTYFPYILVRDLPIEPQYKNDFSAAYFVEEIKINKMKHEICLFDHTVNIFRKSAISCVFNEKYKDEDINMKHLLWKNITESVGYVLV